MSELGNTSADKDYKPSGISKAEERALEAYPTSTPPTWIDGHDKLRQEAFAKGYEQAEKDIKEQMMKEAVEGEVVKDISNKLAVTAKINLDGFKFGDKVRIIIVKEEGK